MKRADVVSGLASAISYIRLHLDERLTLEALAGEAGFSPFHFHRVFRAVVGESMGAYIRRERLQRAAAALRAGHDNIYDLALEAGYETHSAFTRSFTEHFGVAPSAFRTHNSVPIVPPHAMPRPQGRPMEIAVVELPARRLLGLRRLGSYRCVGEAFAALIETACAGGLALDNAEFVGLSYDDPDSVDAEQLRFDACIDVMNPQPYGPLRIIEHEGGRHVAYRHTGPKQLLEHVFDRLFDAVVFSGVYTLRDAPCVEIYRNDESMVVISEQITDVYLPIC